MVVGSWIARLGVANQLLVVFIEKSSRAVILDLEGFPIEALTCLDLRLSQTCFKHPSLVARKETGQRGGVRPRVRPAGKGGQPGQRFPNLSGLILTTNAVIVTSAFCRWQTPASAPDLSKCRASRPLKEELRFHASRTPQLFRT
jgi:hypothetical protein